MSRSAETAIKWIPGHTKQAEFEIKSQSTNLRFQEIITPLPQNWYQKTPHSFTNFHFYKEK